MLKTAHVPNKPLIRQVNDYLAQAHQLAVQAGETDLAASIAQDWQIAEALAAHQEDRRPKKVA